MDSRRFVHASPGVSRRPATEPGVEERREAPPQPLDPKELPYLLTADEAAALLRTSRKAIYARAERGLLPGVVRDGRRLLVRRDELLRFLEEKRTASPGGIRR